MLHRLSARDITAIADRVGWFSIEENEIDQYVSLAESVLSVIQGAVDAGFDGPGPDEIDHQPPSGRRDAGRRPMGDDPLNAIIRWCDVQDGNDGPLSDVRIALKDSVAVAGVPMSLGSRWFNRFTPTVDSVVTARLLAAGARIVAMTNMDDSAFSGAGDTSAFGPILNPFDPTRSAGGSSGGSAAALAYRDRIDATIGCDQGGSIRLPAAWCGVLGLKPTHGLVPYTGIGGIDATFDHAGPMARSTKDLARVLDVIAGPHPSDPRQARTPAWPTGDVVERVNKASADLRGVRLGVLEEGFSDADPARAAASRAIRAVIEDCARAGAEITEVSIPQHLTAGGIAFAGFIEGMYGLLQSGGNGRHWHGTYWPEFALNTASSLQTHGQDLPAQLKIVTVLGAYLQHEYAGAVYATAQNQRGALRAAFDKGLEGVDALILPTTPYAAYKYDDELELAAAVMRGWEPLANTSPTDMSGHPALTIPAAEVDGLPLGAMLIGRQFDDALLLEIAARYERSIGWAHSSVERFGAGQDW
jgi:amidase